jgi:hypothetical protein
MSTIKVQEYLDHRLKYDPLIGHFTWLYHPHSRSLNGTLAGNISTEGYRAIGIGSKSYYAHRLAWLVMEGVLPTKGTSIDHIDGDRLNNAWGNLRLATKSQNGQNSKLKVTNSSGIKGVHWHAASKTWVVAIMLDYRNYHGGYYTSLPKAELAAINLRNKLHSEYANHGQ